LSNLSIFSSNTYTFFSGEKAGFIWSTNPTGAPSVALESRNYEVDNSADISLKALLADSLKIISSIEVVRTFCTKRNLHEYGLVSHALSGELINYNWEINERITQLQTMHVSLCRRRFLGGSGIFLPHKVFFQTTTLIV